MDDETSAQGPLAPAGFERLSLLGRGGTATVYSATRIGDSRHVALKVFDRPDSSAFDRQKRAAERLGRVDGILELLGETMMADGRPCLVFPFVTAGSLSDRMDRFGPSDPAQVGAIGAAIARALAAAHRAGVLHRDVKPSNVLLDGDDHPLLADFGAATTLDPTTATDTLAITVMYAAPEVLESGASEPRSDIYSLGLTLLALSIGRHPIGDQDDTSLGTLVKQICSDGAPDPGRLGLPEGLAAVLRKATALEPVDRYATGEELAAALEEVAADPGTAPDDSTGSSPSAPKRRPALMAAAATMAVVALAGATAWIMGNDSAVDRSQIDELAETEDPVTEPNGVLGPLYEQSYANYVGLLDPGCQEDDRLVELAIHPGPEDQDAGVGTPWEAVSGEGAGTFMSYMPCDTGIDEARYILGSTGRWFVVVAEFTDEQYETMSGYMRENENSPSPDYTVDDDVLKALEDPSIYRGWAMIDQDAE